ncbi:M10 family metallopeptidase C-terminal domain-containing protein [Proteus sp. fly-1013]|uniref:M10 family metallopeptidase C-terminal domain-containing protein n=1 Tax=Proteus sp. fly-1013 TaxID=3136673 RepID=UPI0032DB77C1
MSQNNHSPEFITVINVIKNYSPFKRWNKKNKDDIFTEITYSFPDWSSLRGDEYKTITTLNKYQEEIAEKILQQWSDITNIKFIKKNNKYDTNIKFGVYNNVNEITKDTSHLVTGVATFPDNNTNPSKRIEKVIDYSDGGHVWINISSTVCIKKFNKKEMTLEQKNEVNLFKEKSDNIKYYYLETNSHITLYKNSNENSHINNQPIILSKGNGETQTYIHETGHALGLPHTFKWNDYNNPDVEANTFKYTVMTYRYPQIEEADFGGLYPISPLLIDIYVIQKFYGVNVTTRTDDTIYGFDSNTQRDHYSLTSPDDVMITCIWDADGNDTLNFYKYNKKQKIDLNEGAFSDTGGLRGNLSIAYGAIIENAIGGINDDIIIGNNVDNHLYGNNGNDIIYGNNGNDILQGGKGNDWLYGGEGDDILYGSDGNDILWDDNGCNQLSGGKGRDIFILSLGHNNSHNKIMDFNKNEDLLLFSDEDDHIFNIIDLIKNKKIIVFNDNENVENTTKISISEEIKSINHLHTIELVGYFSFDDIFNS